MESTLVTNTNEMMISGSGEMICYHYHGETKTSSTLLTQGKGIKVFLAWEEINFFRYTYLMSAHN